MFLQLYSNSEFLIGKMVLYRQKQIKDRFQMPTDIMIPHLISQRNLITCDVTLVSNKDNQEIFIAAVEIEQDH